MYSYSFNNIGSRFPTPGFWGFGGHPPTNQPPPVRLPNDRAHKVSNDRQGTIYQLDRTRFGDNVPGGCRIQ